MVFYLQVLWVICKTPFTASDNYKKSTDTKKIRLAAIIIVSLFGLVCISVTTGCIIYKWVVHKRNKMQKVKNATTILGDDDFLKFTDVNNIYNIKVCAICLDEFSNDSEVIQLILELFKIKIS